MENAPIENGLRSPPAKRPALGKRATCSPDLSSSLGLPRERTASDEMSSSMSSSREESPQASMMFLPGLESNSARHSQAENQAAKDLVHVFAHHEVEFLAPFQFGAESVGCLNWS
jgi:hypothetical protein